MEFRNADSMKVQYPGRTRVFNDETLDLGFGFDGFDEFELERR
jgi:hypothetical protein